MATVANLFESFLDQAAQGNINWPSDAIKIALLTASASPSLAAWVHYSDLTNEVAAGNGYTSGGATLGSKTHVATVANSWGTQWAGTTAYVAGQIVIPTVANGFVYQCVVGGTSGNSQPTWPTIVGESVSDSGVTWSCLGESVTVFSSAAPSWTVPAAGSLAFRYAVIYDAQSGTGATEPLIALVDFGATQTFAAPAGAPLTATVSPQTIAAAVTGWFVTAPA